MSKLARLKWTLLVAVSVAVVVPITGCGEEPPPTNALPADAQKEREEIIKKEYGGAQK